MRRFTNLKARRLESGLLQIELAQRAGIERARMSLLECGHIPAKLAELERIAAVLGVRVESLIDRPEAA